ncbi:MAG: dephospho-CoA kinase [Erysipelotrichaceae bacterium]|nr:dephospho-CoA kinase [Erysipelotrichaceae bacterium]
MRYVIGVTGGIASGKSQVCKIIKDSGYNVIDCDQIARESSKIGKPMYKAILDHYGRGYLLPDGNIDRYKLGQLVFNDSLQREILNNLTHPIIIEELKKQITSYEGLIFVEMPLLFESKLELMFDRIICVYLNKKLQINRLMLRDDIDQQYAKSKIESQLDLKYKKKRSHYVIDTGGDLNKTRAETISILQKIEGELLYGNS